ncbi:MAG: hypothetical protein K5776_13595 [Lachnospiraceae bacterium]|nr:hypothetical protein [Lachnospiraceae bacterium]
MKKRILSILTAGMIFMISGCTMLSGKTGLDKDDESGLQAQIQNNTETQTKPEDENKPGNVEEADGKDNNVTVGNSNNENTNSAETLSEEEWKKIYLSFLEKDIDSIMPEYDSEWRDSWNMGFIYVNDDDVPELVLCSGYEAAGNVILTIINGEVKYCFTNRLNFYFIERENIINNNDGIMGDFYDYIFKIGDEGFETVATGHYYEANYYSGEESTDEWVYCFDDKVLKDKDEYLSNLKKYIETDRIKFYYDGTGYDEMIAYLSGKGYKDYKEAYSDIVKKGVSFMNEELDSFALIERRNQDPMLVCIGEGFFKIYSYDNGLLYAGDAEFFGENKYDIIFSGSGVLYDYAYFTNETYCSARTFSNGTSLAEYNNSIQVVDENGEAVTDKENIPLYTYTVNGFDCTYEEFDGFVSKFYEDELNQLTPNNAEIKYMTYLDKDELLKELSR